MSGLPAIHIPGAIPRRRFHNRGQPKGLLRDQDPRTT